MNKKLGIKELEKMSSEEILKAKSEAGQHRDFSDKAGPVLVQMTADDCKAQCKNAGVEYKKGYEERVLRYVCSDESVDRMGDVIKQDGWNLENFKKNPVVMGFHDYGSFPVGNALSVGVSDGKLKMNILFADKDVNEDGDKAFKMAKSGFMRAGSVGFNPSKYHMATPEEQKDLGAGKHGLIFEEQELMEFSVCGVPANANALQESFSKGFKKADFKGFVKSEILEEVEEPNANAEESTTSEEQVTEKPEAETESESTESESTEKGSDVSTELFTKEEIATIKELLLTTSATTYIEKAGAVLSKKNKASIETAIEGMTQATDALKSLLKNASPSQDEQEEQETNTDVKTDNGELSDEKFIIDIDLDSIDDSSEGEALYEDDSIINIDLN